MSGEHIHDLLLSLFAIAMALWNLRLMRRADRAEKFATAQHHAVLTTVWTAAALVMAVVA